MTALRAAAALLQLTALVAAGSETAQGHAWLDGAKSVVKFLLPVPPEWLTTQAHLAYAPSLLATEAVRGTYPWNKRDQSPTTAYDPHDPNSIANNVPSMSIALTNPGMPDSQVKKDVSPAVPQYHNPETPEPLASEAHGLHSAWKELLVWVILSGLFGYMYMHSREKHVEELFSNPGYPELQEEDFRTWQHSWYDCFAHTDITVMSFICPCVRWAETMSYVRPFLDWYLFWMVYVACWLLARLGWFSFYGWILGSLICTYFRRQLRAAYKMDTSSTTVVSDCALYFFCGPCAIAQEAKHVESSMQHHHFAVYPRPGFTKYEKRGDYDTFAPPPQSFPAPLAEDPRPPSRSAVRSPAPTTQFYAPQEVRIPSRPPSAGPGSRGPSAGPQYRESPAAPLRVPTLPMSAPVASPPMPIVQVQQYEVTVPPGVVAGQRISYPAQIGNRVVQVECEVPPGLQPGMSFKHRPNPEDIS